MTVIRKKKKKTKKDIVHDYLSQNNKKSFKKLRINKNTLSKTSITRNKQGKKGKEKRKTLFLFKAWANRKKKLKIFGTL